MSVDYYYVNHDKQQFFDCGLGGFDSRFSAIGGGPGARALIILLSSRGTWKGDRISVVSDTSEEYEEVATRGVRVDIEAELMLIEVDGVGWLEDLLDRPSGAFRRSCSYALLLGHPRVTEMLNQKYGIEKWHRMYRKDLQNGTDLWSDKVIAVKNRRIELLKRETTEG